MEIVTEVLVIGSGIGGLYTAAQISKYAEVTLVTKKEKSESSTNYAQGGIASVLDSRDSFDNHINDTLIAGAGLCHKDIVEMIVKEGPAHIKELINLGARFTLSDSSNLDLVREGGHSFPRIVHAKDLTGKEVERTLIEYISAQKNVAVLENHLAIDLLTEHNLTNLKDSPSENLHCWGAYVLDINGERVIKIKAKATVIATGGMGQVYLHTTNPGIATGDGVAMAYRAGARLSNLEFIQFHPTSLYNSGAHSIREQAFLISEAVRGFGGILRNQTGERFMTKYDSRLELAPRDIVARAIDSELKISGEDFVYLDITHKSSSEIKDHFPNIYERCLKEGIDATTAFIPVVPAAHYICGGIIVDSFSRTSINGLYATGEVSMTGVHGANRLASNSLLEALVFASRAAQGISEQIKENSTVLPDIPDWDETNVISPDEKIMISHGERELKQLMSDYVGIVRSNLRLSRAARRIKTLNLEVEEIYKKTKVFAALLELRNLVTSAYLIVKCATLRKESRGLHYSLDYPELNKAGKIKDTIIQNKYQKS